MAGLFFLLSRFQEAEFLPYPCRGFAIVRPFNVPRKATRPMSGLRPGCGARIREI